jgi:hypothetical protein
MLSLPTGTHRRLVMTFTEDVARPWATAAAEALRAPEALAAEPVVPLATPTRPAPKRPGAARGAVPGARRFRIAMRGLLR